MEAPLLGKKELKRLYPGGIDSQVSDLSANFHSMYTASHKQFACHDLYVYQPKRKPKYFPKFCGSCSQSKTR
jgi:hypothetical protein